MDVGEQSTPNEVNQLIGTWRLVSGGDRGFRDKQRDFAWGTKPNGFIVVTPTGR